MAPEQINGRRGDVRTDVYALGSMLFEMLTGEPPFVGGNAQTLLRAKGSEDPRSPRQLLPELDPKLVYGTVNICCVAFDWPPVAVPKPWAHMPVTPVLIRYRIVRFGKSVVPWRIGVDLRQFRQPDAFHVVFAPETRQNHPNKPRLYCYNLAHDWNSALHPNGSYRIDVEASDVHGNHARSNLTFSIGNGLQPL